MRTKPRVVIVTPGSYPIPSSRSSSVEQVVRHVGALMGADTDLWVVGKKTARQPVRETIDGVRYVRPRRTKARRSYLSRVSGAIARLKPGIVQVENRPKLAAALKARHPGRQVWLSLHSTTFLSPKHVHPAALRRALRRVDRIVVNSGFLRDYVARRVPGAARKIVVNYLGVDMNQFVSRWSPQGEAARSELLSALGYENKKILLYVGRLIEKKGIHHLLQAMPGIIERHPDALLIIVGGAAYGVDAVTPYVRRLHAMGGAMPNHVRFIQFVPHDQVHRWYTIADIALVPSFAEEAFGLVNVEAMASGVPVVATDAGGMKELIVDGETGFFVPSSNIAAGIRDRVDLLLSQPELARAMGEASLRRVESMFTWGHTAARLAGWYRAGSSRKRRSIRRKR
ncbi:glycosyltransferase family 4 protein [Paenibacillus sp. TRM 82003]|nr:glycosyltransferase family 4 protein [Paenibacillus sp. TRM 82003]